MKKNILKAFMICSFLFLTACASQVLKEGKQNFDNGQYQQAMNKLMPLADKGNPEAQYAVGYMYYYGQGITPDKKQGLEWINKAAEQGQPEALAAQKAIAKQAALNPLTSN